MIEFRKQFHKLFPYLTPAKSVTVKYMFPVLLGFATAFAANVITSDDISYIKLQPSKSTVLAGEDFAVRVYAYAHTPVNAIDVSITYNEDSVSVNSIDKGESVLTIWTEEPTAKSGIISLRGGTFQRGFMGEHLIATVKLNAKKTGQADFFAKNIRLLAGDGEGTYVTVDDSSVSNKTSLYIYDQNEDPSNIGAEIDLRIKTDIDNDGKVTLRDISVFMVAWRSQDVIYDFNNDGRMTFRDFSIILADFFFK